MENLSTRQIQLFRSLFMGREDVFALRWERDGKSGYTPAYDINWDEYARHKAAGGSLKDFPDKRYALLTDQRIIHHLSGKEVIGVYPLLSDNTSHLIVADFDETIASKRNWMEECSAFTTACKSYRIPAYLERSRSGKGGHVWIFFHGKYPAQKSRRIMLRILEDVGIISPFDKNANYDRLFPNQEVHSGKGLGNLVALPLQKKALDMQNACFIDPGTFAAYPNQWEFLESIQKVTIERLDKVYDTLFLPGNEMSVPPVESSGSPPSLEIKLSNEITLQRAQLTPELIVFLRENLNFINADYVIKKRLGKSTFGTEPYFRMLDENRNQVTIPRGFIASLVKCCREQHLPFQLIDERKKLSDVTFSFKGSLYDYQQQALDVCSKKDMGVIVAPPGSGKTIIALAIVAQKNQPTLIIVHRKQLLQQWVERIQSFLGIAAPFIGKIASGEQKIGTHITVAMIQSIAVMLNAGALYNAFGTIIIDECHHVPAKTFRQVIRQFRCYYLYGLTATPIRKNNDEKLIFIHIGEVIHQVKPTLATGATAVEKIALVIRDTNLFVLFDIKTDVPEVLSQILIHDSARNRLITDDIKMEAGAGRKVLVLTERTAHIEVLYAYLKSQFEIICMSGEDSEGAKNQKFKQVNEGNFQVLISTGQFIGEGADFAGLDCLVLAYPFAFEGKLVQYLGRVQRSNTCPIIYDYRDVYIDYLEDLFRQRNRYYQKLLHSGQLKTHDELTLIFNEDKVYINSDTNFLPISCLDLPIEAERFKEDIAWKVRVLDYNQDAGIAVTEIISYSADTTIKTGKQTALQFMDIGLIRFRTIDTSQLLKAIEIKRRSSYSVQEPVVSYAPPPPAHVDVPTPPRIVNAPSEPNIIVARQPVERVLLKTMKVPFANLSFQHAHVTFPVYMEELSQEVTFTVDNPDIRQQFEAIKQYFSNVLKMKLITANLEVRYNDTGILFKKASSNDINKINQGIIESVRFEFVKREVLSTKSRHGDLPVLNTLDTLIAKPGADARGLYPSEQHLVNDLLSIKSTKHYDHLQFLSSRHVSSVLKMRFIVEPFSFLFLLQGDTRYHIVWETLDTEEATYIWHFDKNIDALRKGLTELESILREIKTAGKQDYLKTAHSNLSRLIHDYNDKNKGFIQWKAALEATLS